MKKKTNEATKKKQQESRMPVRKFTISPSVVRSLESASKWIFLSNHECSRTLLFFLIYLKMNKNLVVHFHIVCSVVMPFFGFISVLIAKDSPRWTFSTRLCLLFQGNINISIHTHICVYITRSQSAISEFCWWKVIKVHNIYTYITWREKKKPTTACNSPRQMLESKLDGRCVFLLLRWF